MSKTERRTARLGGASLAALLLVTLSGPGLTRAAAPETYSLSGYEIWFTPSVGVFAGTGNGHAGDLSAWFSSIEHSQVISPSGTIIGGWATLYRLDGVSISGHFSGGTIVQTNDGAGCTAEWHSVTGELTGVRRSDTAALGSGEFQVTLVHHRAWLFGRCISYSASVSGSISLSF